MTYPMVGSARQNKILSGVPLSQYARFSEHLKSVELSAGEVICEAGESLAFVYFPTTCTTTLMSQTAEGASSELAMTGRDGLVGVSLVLGSGSMNHRVVVQCAGQAFRMPADVFRLEMGRCPELQQLALCYVQALITQMAQSIVCIAHHSVSERVSLWLLFNQDALCSDPLKVTHETIANMLGVRRESVTQALGKFQTAGLIGSGRGKIKILNRDGLQEGVCECFSLVTAETQRLFARLGRFQESAMAPEELGALSVSHQYALLQKYQDTYDFAPVGFVSLDAQGCVVQTNLTGAIMLDIQRSLERSSEFTQFMKPEDRVVFQSFLQEVLSGKCRRHCEVTLHETDHRADMTVRVQATLSEMGDECRLVLIDVTEDKRLAVQALLQERQHQEQLTKQAFMLWFNDHDGFLTSSDASLVEDWRQFAAYAPLEAMDLQGLPLGLTERPQQIQHAPGVKF